MSGVALDDGEELVADAVVVAAGCWSGQLAGWPDAFRPAVRPVKGLTLRLRAGPRSSTLRRTVRGLVHGRTCYLVPRADGTLVVGSTTEERGFDLTVEAGAVGDLLDDARRLVPSVEDYELTETTTGLRPGSPDNAPMVGRCGLSGSSWPPGTIATASCSPPSPPPKSCASSTTPTALVRRARAGPPRSMTSAPTASPRLPAGRRPGQRRSTSRPRPATGGQGRPR